MKKTILALAAIAFASPVLAGQEVGGNPNPSINMSGNLIEYPTRVTVPTTIIESPAVVTTPATVVEYTTPSAAVITYPVIYSQVVLPKDSDKKKNRKPVGGARGYEASVATTGTVTYVSRY